MVCQVMLATVPVEPLELADPVAEEDAVELEDVELEDVEAAVPPQAATATAVATASSPAAGRRYLMCLLPVT
jgi:hypothetical protein